MKSNRIESSLEVGAQLTSAIPLLETLLHVLLLTFFRLRRFILSNARERWQKKKKNSPERHVCWFRGSGYEPRLYISELSTMFTTSLCMETEPKINQASERRIYGDLEWGREKVFLRRFYAMPLWQCRNGGRCGGWVGLVWRWMERENTGRSSVSYLQLCWLAGSSRLCFEIHFKFRMLILIQQLPRQPVRNFLNYKIILISRRWSTVNYAFRRRRYYV